MLEHKARVPTCQLWCTGRDPQENRGQAVKAAKPSYLQQKALSDIAYRRPNPNYAEALPLPLLLTGCHPTSQARPRTSILSPSLRSSTQVRRENSRRQGSMPGWRWPPGGTETPLAGGSSLLRVQQLLLQLFVSPPRPPGHVAARRKALALRSRSRSGEAAEGSSFRRAVHRLSCRRRNSWRE